jgi:hypothetical protein
MLFYELKKNCDTRLLSVFKLEILPFSFLCVFFLSVVRFLNSGPHTCLFALIFSYRVSFFSGLALNQNPPTYA